MRTQWRSVGELEGSDEFRGWLEREFPQGAQELEMDETSRRSFVKLMGASTALAGFGVSCSRPLQHLVPFNEHVEWIIPGNALYYSTVKPRLGGVGCDPLVATTYEGRPTKVDGNRLHPGVKGASTAFTQASILDLYDQDRARGYFENGEASVASAFSDSVLGPLREGKSGKGVGIVLSQTSSPTRQRLIREVGKALPGISFYSYESLNGAGAAAARKAYGSGVVASVDLSKAKKILSLDRDFLGNEPVGEDSLREFSGTRDPEGEMSRLYVAESAFTVTGGQADHRYRTAPSQILPILSLVAEEVASALGDATLGALAKEVSSKVVASVYRGDWIKECAADLVASKGASIVLAGERQPEPVHVLAIAVNKALGAYDSLISLADLGLPEMAGVEALAADLKKKKLSTLFVANEGDLAFDAPSDLGLAELLSEVETLVRIGYRQDVTGNIAGWFVPKTHYLESWGDCKSLNGVYSVQQPMINPMWGGVSDDAFLLSLIGAAHSEEDVLAEVKKSFASLGGKDWTSALRDGYAKEIASSQIAFSGNVGVIGNVSIPDLPHSGGLEVVLTAGNATYDGRFANNGWLQEAPDPITKLTWDNAALISFDTAEALGLEDEDLVEVSVGQRKVTVPVLRSPGQADFTLSVAVGYYGELLDATVSKGAGFNVYPLRTSAAPYFVPGAAVSKSVGTYRLALTAEHYSMEGRAIAREGTAEMYAENKHFAEHQGMDSHIPKNISLYEGPDYENGGVQENQFIKQIPGHEFRVDPLHQWAMTVDLNSCTGCNACVIACQAENNIPIVGKDQVLAGREMHWIRMDRYFTSPRDYKTVAAEGLGYRKKLHGEPGRRKVEDDQIEMLPQPVACQQCESAPCETVCPVNATVHTADGLNAMTYNRCIGTRYCANNCPYKARRFNYYDYNKRPVAKIDSAFGEVEGIKLGPLAPASGNATTTQQLQKNPNVTVRMRGVIEKCTYCVQRISKAKIAAKAAAQGSPDVQVKANSFTVACQDACGADAIVFGNLKAKDDIINSKKAKKSPRNYDLLKYIGTRPRTSYLARIKNPNMKMPGADQVGTVTSKMH